MTDGQFVAALLAVIAPLVLAFFKRLNLSKEAMSAIVLAGCVVVAGFGLFLSGQIDPRVCAAIDIIECVKVVFTYVTLSLGVAFIYYKMVWQALGIDDKIAGK
jgi:hypothetical protein